MLGYKTNDKSLVCDQNKYSSIVGIDFGSTLVRRAKQNLFLENSSIGVLSYPSVCLYSCENRDYDDAVFQEWGHGAEVSKEDFDKGIYIDKLRDKVEYLFDIKSEITKSKDQLYFKAIVEYFEQLTQEFREGEDRIGKTRYVMTYPSEWTSEKVAYLRSLVQMAGIIDENDHPDRLMMYNEGESIIRALQTPSYTGSIKQGYTYLVCDVGGGHVKMSLIDVKEPDITRKNIKKAVFREWDVNYAKVPSRLLVGKESFLKSAETFLLSRFSTSSKTFTLDDVYQKDGALYDSRKDFCSLIDRIIDVCFEELSNEIIAKDDSFEFEISSILQQQMLKGESCNLSQCNLSTTSYRNGAPFNNFPSSGMGSTLSVSPTELREHVMRPVCGKIVDYLRDIFQGPIGGDIEALVLTGGLCASPFLKELIKDVCITERKKYITFSPDEEDEDKFNYGCRFGHEIIRGAMLMAIDGSPSPSETTLICLENESSKSKPVDVYVFIDYGRNQTSVSYIYAQPGKESDYANLDHLEDWPGHSNYDRDFPTLDIMIIPSDELSGSQKIISLKENPNHKDHFFKITQAGATCYEYYTFLREKHSITMLIHTRKKRERKFAHAVVEEVQIPQTELLGAHTIGGKKDSALLTKKSSCYHNESIDFAVTQKEMTYQEYFAMYAKYLISLLQEFFSSAVGAKKCQLRFCVTIDDLADPNGLALTGTNMDEISEGCNLEYDSLHLLKRTEATAIYCRQLMKELDNTSPATYTPFLQVQFTQSQCQLLLNRAPFLRREDDDNESKAWSGIYKYAESKVIPINVMDIICNNLWIHIQDQQQMLKRCGHHQNDKRYFNTKTMEIFKQSVLNHLTKAKLNLWDGKKGNKIIVCENDPEKQFCRIDIENMDLLQFCMTPAIERLTSEIHSYANYIRSCEQVEISNIFVMGVFLLCQYQKDYKFLEELLFLKLRRINLVKFNDFTVRDVMENIKVIKVEVPEYELAKEMYDNNIISHNNEKQDRKSLARIALCGSVSYCTSPNDRLYKRIAVNSYFATISVYSQKNWSRRNGGTYLRSKRNTNEIAVYATGRLCKSQRTHRGSVVSVIEKGYCLETLRSNGKDIDLSYTISYCQEDINVRITIFEVSKCGIYKRMLHTFHFCYKHSGYPILLKVRPSSTRSHKCWVEYDQNNSTEVISVQEFIWLQTDYQTV